MWFRRSIVLALVGAAASAYQSEAADTESSNVLVLTKDTFKAAVAEHPLMMVKFYAPWCGHCKAMAPEYEKAATELKGTKLTLAKVDCTTEQDVCTEHGVQGYPTVKVFRDGKASAYEKARKADAIVQYMKNQLLPVVTDVTAENFDTFTTSAKIVVVGFFKTTETEAAKAFKSVASAHRDEYVFGWSTDAALATKAGVASVPGAVLFKKFDEGKNVFPENVGSSKITVEALTKFVAVNSIPLVDDIGPENYAKYTESGVPLAYAFVASEEHRAALGPSMEKLAKQYRSKISFVYLDATKFGGHASNLNLKEEWPAFAIQKPDGSKFPFEQTKELTAEALEAFVAEFSAGKVSASIKTEPVPENNDGPVKVIVATTFKEIAFDESADVLVEFYAPWCGHCKKLEPIYTELGEKLAAVPSIVIAKMDATANDLPADVGFQIEGFPTIKLFKKGTNEVLDFSGARTVEGFVKFLKEHAADKDFEVAEGSTAKDAAEHDEL